jgi:hypothetical protein
VAALDAVDAAQEVLWLTCTDGVGNVFRVEMALRLESLEWMNRGLSYRVVGEIVDPPDAVPQRGVRPGLAQRLRVPRGEIARIRPRRSLTGEVLAPVLPRLAEAVAAGLVEHACVQDAAFVAELGRGIADRLNPDGLFDERDRPTRRGLTLSKQASDGVRKLSGWLTPEARAYFEAIGAAVRPGHRLPGSEQTVVDAAADGRSPSQRLHDGSVWGMRTALGSGNPGTHRGIPVTVIATTTVQNLEQAPAARTGGG